MSPISELHQYSETKADAALSRHIDIIRNHYISNVPKIFHDTLISKTITALFFVLQKTRYENLWYESVSRTAVITRTIESLFTDNLTSLSLDFDQFIMFRNSLLYKSYLLSGLTGLYLNFKMLDTSDHSDHTYNTDIVVISLLKDLRNLKYLTINYICTDNILRCIVYN